MHLIMLVETNAQSTFRPNWEIACERVRLVVEGIAGLHAHPQLMLPGRNLHFF
jgi:hypothetical protein